ncbi:hypothetical protein [Paraburkholderia sp. XV]|uniref:hypothetical protein n=1 Tax=Paraburkholderia sp. XV TaxID=2831520 RepID=UPI001CD6F104|nr:hypothetical protein [Paraburkholderia sp. XV]
MEKHSQLSRAKETNWPGKLVPATSRKPDGLSWHEHDETDQDRQDEREKQKHSQSENALKSTQDKNPVPPGTTHER